MELKSRGYRVAILKHDTHEFEMDKEGKDTWRFAKAGADLVSISNADKIATIEKTKEEVSLEKIISGITNVDLIITEGYRAGKVPKIAVLRKETGHQLSVSIKDLIAIVTDTEIEEDIPKFDLEDIKGMASFLEVKIKTEKIPFGIELEEAIEIILNTNYSVKEEVINIESSMDRVLSTEIIATEMIPPFDRSPLDGYSFRSEDTIGATKETPVTFKIVEEIAAGQFSKRELGKNEAVKILTGAPIPCNADAVSRFEDTVYDKDNVKIFQEFTPNSNIVFKGEDVSKGDKIAGSGFTITPPLIGLMASLGISEIKTYSKPIISIINTGEELISINEPLRPGKIRNSSYYTISAYLQKAGVVTCDGGRTKDDAEDIAKTIKKSLATSDLIITTGGVSVGDYDLVQDALELLGADILFWKINIKPGGAVIAAVLNGKLILGLSGNPGSAIVCLQTLGMPYIRKISGSINVFNEKIKVRMYKDYKKASPDGRFLRGRLIIENGNAYFEERGPQKNGAISSLLECDLIGIIPSGSGPLKKENLIEAYKI